jgi:hypothetical protein
MNDISSALIRFVDTYYKKSVKSKYNIDLKFSNPRIIKNNVIVDVHFPEDADLDWSTFEALWEDLYGAKEMISVIDNDYKSLNFNPIF